MVGMVPVQFQSKVPTIWKVSFHMSLTFDFHVDQTRRTACVENCAPEEGTGSDPSLVSQ